MLDWVYMSILELQDSSPFTAVTRALTRALKGFFLWFKPANWRTSINPNLVYALANRRFFPRFSSTRREMSAFKQFLLHVKIAMSTNLWSVCRRKLELSTYLNTESYNQISFLRKHFRKQPPLIGNLCPLSV